MQYFKNEILLKIGSKVKFLGIMIKNLFILFPFNKEKAIISNKGKS